MKKLLAVVVVASAVTLGGCHVFKQKSAANGAAAPAKQVAVIPALTLQSLDDRLRMVEARNSAVDARARAAKRSATPAPAGQPYPYYVK